MSKTLGAFESSATDSSVGLYGTFLGLHVLPRVEIASWTFMRYCNDGVELRVLTWAQERCPLPSAHHPRSPESQSIKPLVRSCSLRFRPIKLLPHL